MQESFEFTKHIKNLLFYGWTSSSSAGLTGACFAMVGFAVMLEATRMVSFQLSLRIKRHRWTPVQRHATSATNPLVSPAHRAGQAGDCRVAVSLLQTLVYILRMLLGYFLMLAIMSYNAWLLIATILGSTIGYLLFGATMQGGPVIMSSSPREGESPSKNSDKTTSTVTSLQEIASQNLLEENISELDIMQHADRVSSAGTTSQNLENEPSQHEA